MKRLLVSVCIAFCCLSSLVTSAAESTNTVESATRRGLVMVTRAASNWQQHKTCFSCHHQTLPMLTAVTAERMGFPHWWELMANVCERQHHALARSLGPQAGLPALADMVKLRDRCREFRDLHRRG